MTPKVATCLDFDRVDLNATSRMLVGASADGTLLSKTFNEAYEILDIITNNNYDYDELNCMISASTMNLIGMKVPPRSESVIAFDLFRASRKHTWLSKFTFQV